MLIAIFCIERIEISNRIIHFFFWKLLETVFCIQIQIFRLIHCLVSSNIISHNHNKSIILCAYVCVHKCMSILALFSRFTLWYSIEREKNPKKDCRIDLFGGILLKIGVKIRTARYNPNDMWGQRKVLDSTKMWVAHTHTRTQLSVFFLFCCTLCR